MKALSLDQPWASGVALRLKRIETRGRRTSHRGRLAIHATLTHTRRRRSALIAAWTSLLSGPAELERRATAAFARVGITVFRDLPAGAILATCDLIDCIPVEELLKAGLVSPLEQKWGNYSKGRYGYLLDNIVALEKPVPARGYQYLFDWDERSAS